MNEMNHSEFIRNHPKLSVADLIQEAAKQGMDIKKNLIYNVRSKDRKVSGATAPSKKKASKKPVSTVNVKAAPSKKVSKKAKVAAAKPAVIAAAAAPAADVVASRGLVSRKVSGSKMTLTVTLDVHDPASLKNSRGLISSLFSV